MPSLPLSRALPAIASAVMPAPCRLAGRAHQGQSATGANNAAAVGLVLFQRHDIDDTNSFWSQESTARMHIGLEIAGLFGFSSPITAAKAQLLAMVMAVLCAHELDESLELWQ